MNKKVFSRFQRLPFTYERKTLENQNCTIKRDAEDVGDEFREANCDGENKQKFKYQERNKKIQKACVYTKTPLESTMKSGASIPWE